MVSARLSSNFDKMQSVKQLEKREQMINRGRCVLATIDVADQGKFEYLAYSLTSTKFRCG
jgi:hypothetical protein